MELKILIPIILAPIITALVGLIFSKYGITGKTKHVEYLTKRVELIEKLLLNDKIKVNKIKLKDELDDIVTHLSLSSMSNDEFVHLEYKDRAWYKKILTLPKPKTIGAKMATFIYYLYGISAIFYIPMIISIVATGVEDWQFGIVGLASSIVITLLCRVWAIKSAYRYSIVTKAKKEIFLSNEIIPKDDR